MPRICVIGHQNITKYLIDELIDNKFNITHIICTDNVLKYKISDHYNFKKNKKNYPMIKIYKANKYSLKSIKDKRKILDFDVDIFIVFGWSRLIPSWLINNSNCVIGMHGGMHKPPRCRGRAVFNWALIGGYKSFYLYVMRLDSGIDSGKILSIDKISITNSDDIETLYLKYAVNGFYQISKIIKKWPLINDQSIKISKTKPTYLPKRNPEDGYINLLEENKNIENFVKAIKNPFPGAFLLYNKIVIIINEIVSFNIEEKNNYKIGTIMNIFENKMFTIKCKYGTMLIKQWNSNTKWVPKKRMLLKYSKKFQFKKIVF